jgi:hypothetical protein
VVVVVVVVPSMSPSTECVVMVGVDASVAAVVVSASLVVVDATVANGCSDMPHGTATASLTCAV